MGENAEAWMKDNFFGRDLGMRLGVIKMAIRKLGGDDFRGLEVDMGGLFGVDENMVVRLRKSSLSTTPN